MSVTFGIWTPGGCQTLDTCWLRRAMFGLFGVGLCRCLREDGFATMPIDHYYYAY